MHVCVHLCIHACVHVCLHICVFVLTTRDQRRMPSIQSYDFLLITLKQHLSLNWEAGYSWASLLVSHPVSLCLPFSTHVTVLKLQGHSQIRLLRGDWWWEAKKSSGLCRNHFTKWAISQFWVWLLIYPLYCFFSLYV